VAAWPPPEVVAALAALERPDEPGVRWVRPEHWHVTLRFLGDADPAAVTAALAAAPLPAATARLGPKVSRLGRTTVVVPVAGLEELGDAVAAATADLGEPPDPRGFRGHLTLARLRHRGACGVTGSAVRAGFDVGEVVVVSSVLGPTGPAYDVVGRVPCG
jgi:2'-5' RNA ligase